MKYTRTFIITQNNEMHYLRVIVLLSRYSRQMTAAFNTFDKDLNQNTETNIFLLLRA